MADETKPEQRPMKWIPSKSGSPEIYGNFSHVSWTLFDVRIQVGQLIPDPASPANFVAEERAAVTMAWPQAKILRDILTDLVASYERTNGEIQQLKLPSDPSMKPKQ